jgi:phosphopantetheinyl transferase (holo-ACP synthase)
MDKERQITERMLIADFEKQIGPERYTDFFTESEIARYGKRRGKGGLAARYLIKKILLENASIEGGYTALEILNEESGKPVLKLQKPLFGNSENIHISISHTKHEVAVFVLISYE